LLLLGGCLLLGLISGEYAWALVLGLAGYLGWTLRQLWRLQQWLKSSDTDAPPPDSHGIWGDIFDSLYHLQRRDLRLRAQLQTVIDRVQGSTSALKEAVVMLDSEGNLEWWNPAAERLLADALALEAAGAQLMVLECVPVALAKRITEALTIPVIGIGAGNVTDGQILVMHDAFGITGGHIPKFAKNFLAGTGDMRAAVRQYVSEVEAGTYPGEEHSFH